MRPIDAAIKDLEMIGDCRTCGNKTPFCDSNPDGCKGYKWRGAPPRSAAEENSPLTLEGLREMDGEPVWCVDGRGNRCWCLVNCEDGLPCCYDNETGLWEGCFYGMTGDGQFGLHQGGWLAYHRKPEETT